MSQPKLQISFCVPATNDEAVVIKRGRSELTLSVEELQFLALLDSVLTVSDQTNEEANTNEAESIADAAGNV